MVPLLDTILDEIPAPDVDIDGPVALQICTVDHSSYEGRIGVAACPLARCTRRSRCSL